MISCERAWELLSQQLDEPLSPQEKQELEEHLAACPSCRKDKEELELLDQALRNLGEIQAPADFTQRVMAQMQQQTQSKPKVIPLWRRPQVRALAGLAAWRPSLHWHLPLPASRWEFERRHGHLRSGRSILPVVRHC